MPNIQKFTPKIRGAFLNALRDIPNVTRACRIANITRQWAYEMKRSDAQFASEWEDALDQGIEAMEAEAMRRAVEGIDKPIFYQGDEVALLREYSDTLMIFLLKAHRPERYRESSNIDITSGGAPITYHVTFGGEGPEGEGDSE